MKKSLVVSGGGGITLLLVVVVLGLFSLIGCDNGNGGSSSPGGNPSVTDEASPSSDTGGENPSNPGGSESNNFVGTWKDSDGKTLIFGLGDSNNLGAGSVTGTLISGEGDCFYMVTNSTTTSTVAVIKKSTEGQDVVATVTFNSRTGKLGYVKTGSDPVTLTKQQ